MARTRLTARKSIEGCIRISTGAFPSPSSYETRLSHITTEDILKGFDDWTFETEDKA
jgi:hypothetical protein